MMQLHWVKKEMQGYCSIKEEIQVYQSWKVKGEDVNLSLKRSTSFQNLEYAYMIVSQTQMATLLCFLVLSY